MKKEEIEQLVEDSVTPYLQSDGHIFARLKVADKKQLLSILAGASKSEEIADGVVLDAVYFSGVDLNDVVLQVKKNIIDSISNGLQQIDDFIDPYKTVPLEVKYKIYLEEKGYIVTK